jgi:gliding motility-associated lipoprotein GldH
MKRLLRNSLTAVAMMVMAACDSNMVYYSYQHVDNTWRGSDTLFFTVSTRDSLLPLTTEAEVRFNESYPYNELTLTATHNLRDSARYETDTIRIDMTDRTGTRKGSNWSCLYQASGRMRVTRTAHPGDYTIKIAPLTADSVVCGLNDIGIRMSRLAEPTKGQK